MAILQALLSLISRSAGKILNAIFGWAVRALFGPTSPRQQTVLSGLVAAAAAWPLLLVGVIAPKIAALVIAFVPIPKWVPSWTIRVAWTVLALAVPLVLGLVVASKAPPLDPPEGYWKKLARGVPITLGLASAFFVMFVSVPVLRIASILRGRKDRHVPLIADARVYHDVARRVADVVRRHGFMVSPATPPGWMSLPSRILLKLGGRAFRGYMPERLEYFHGPDLDVALYANGLLLRGRKERVGWAHSVVAEALAPTEALQTTDANAQQLEKEILRVWQVYADEPRAHAHSPVLHKRLHEIVVRLGALQLPEDDWQIVYRKTLQLGRALAGERQLLEETARDAGAMDALPDGATSIATTSATATSSTSKEDPAMHDTPALPPGAIGPARTETHAEELSLKRLVGSIVETTTALAKKEIELAKVELKRDLQAEAGAAKGLGVGAVFALVTLTLLFVTAAMALEGVLPGWAAGLIVSGFTLAVAVIAGLIGWGKRVKSPLAMTRKTLEEDVRWTRERLA